MKLYNVTFTMLIEKSYFVEGTSPEAAESSAEALLKDDYPDAEGESTDIFEINEELE